MVPDVSRWRSGLITKGISNVTEEHVPARMNGRTGWNEGRSCGRGVRKSPGFESLPGLLGPVLAGFHRRKQGRRTVLPMNQTWTVAPVSAATGAGLGSYTIRTDFDPA